MRLKFQQTCASWLVYGGGSIRVNGVYDAVMKALENRVVVEFSGIAANPEYETCLKAIELVHRENIGYILAVGGGSVIDAAKFIALGSKAEGDLWDIFVKAQHPSEALPLGTILTLPATGTEMNDRSVLTRVETQDKRSFRTPLVYPKFSVLDPELTYSLPLKQIGNGGGGHVRAYDGTIPHLPCRRCFAGFVCGKHP